MLESEPASSRVEREAAFKQALMAARRSSGNSQRPSVESVLHHLMPGRFVVHLHATTVNQFACSRNGRALVSRYLSSDVAWVDLVDPGFILAKTLQAELQAFRARTGKARPRAVIMQNHGVVVSGDTPEEAKAQLDWLLDELRAVKGQAAPETTSASARPATETSPSEGLAATVLADFITAAGEPHPEVMFDGSDLVVDFVAREDGRDLALGGPLTPDQIVYCLSFPLWVDKSGDEVAASSGLRLGTGLQGYTQRYGGPPKVVLIQDVGMLTWGVTRPEADIARLVYADAIKVMTGALDLGGVEYLDDDFRTFIENWELESYRRKRLFGTT